MNVDKGIFALLLLGALLWALASHEEPPAVCPDGQCPIPAHLQVNEADVPAGYAETPTMNLPPELRTSNWGGGSCVHASTYHLLQWNGMHDFARWWKETYSGGEYLDRLARRMEAAGLRYAYTGAGDVEFLEWCFRTRRGAGIFYFPNHAINLIHLDQEKAILLDNNRKDAPITVPREEFLRRWKGYGGVAWTLVYAPPPPLPH